MAALRLYGLEPFDETVESFGNYLERFDIYVEANAIEKVRRKAVFLSLLGARMYGLLASLTAPLKPADKALTLDKLRDTLKDHLSPSPLEIAEVYRFHCRRQQTGETIREFLVQLRALAEHCNFGDYRKKAIRNQLVCGVRCEATKRRLLCEKDLTLSTCIDIATAMEASAAAVDAMSSPTVAEVNTLRRTPPTLSEPCVPCGVATCRRYRHGHRRACRKGKERKVSMPETVRAHYLSGTGVPQQQSLHELSSSSAQSARPPASPHNAEGVAAAGLADGPWQCVHVDFAGPINNMHFLVVVDEHSKWPEVLPLKRATAAATVAALRTVFARQGLPRLVVTDNGPQFRSREFTDFLLKNKVQHSRTALRYQTGNDTKEFVTVFKQAFKELPGPAQHKVDNFLLRYRSTACAASGCVPSELLMGRKLRTCVDLLCSPPSVPAKRKPPDARCSA